LITVNHRRPLLRDKRVRLALGMALDRERLVRDVLQRAGRPASSLQPEGIAGRRPELWPAEDAQRARELLADAGYAAGRGFPELTLTYRTGARPNAVAEYLRQQWQETLGIRVRLERMDRREFFAWKLQPGWTEEGDLKLDAWITDYDDPYNWFNELWDSASDPTQFNGGWQHPYYNQLVRLARVEPDPKARLELYQQAEAVLAQSYPHIPLYHIAYEVLVKPYVQQATVARIGAYTPLVKIAVGEH
jgi:oligopeptide transport system substrate-binding protein